MTDATPQLPRVVGLLAVRDEWPLAAVALVHALLHHVDAVVVLDHASSDATPAGLALLKASALGERIQLLHLDSADYRQEAFMNAMVEVSQAWAPDWIYPFDADEFLLVSAGLPRFLGSLPDQIDAVHYELENWISTPEFDESDLDDYLELELRSLPDLPIPLIADAPLIEAISKARVNYFRWPFGQKVIFRNTGTAWLRAGAHGLRHFMRERSLLVHRSRLRAAHLPLLSRAKLNRKAALGYRHRMDGAPPSFGWQNQMLNDLEQLGQLDAFWSRHSLDPGHTFSIAQLHEPGLAGGLRGGADHAVTSEGLHVCRDPSLAMALTPSIAQLRALALDPQTKPLPRGTGERISLPLPADLYRLALRASTSRSEVPTT